MLLALSLVPVLKQQFIKLVNGTFTIQQINIKNQTYYFFNDVINIEDFISKLLKIDKILYKNNGIYYIGYITIKKIDDYENINSLNPLHLMIGRVDGFIEKKKMK